MVMTAMEDNGTATALMRLAKAGRGSTSIACWSFAPPATTPRPPPGESASWHISAEYVLGGRPAIESAYQVGSVVGHEILDHWSQYKHNLPGE